jgi:hypothetical protein
MTTAASAATYKNTGENMSDLSEIKSIKASIAELIARVDALAAAALVVEIPSMKVDLREGERYAGLILKSDGTPSHHVVLMPGWTESNWDAAVAWALALGGDLPDRCEQSLLYANLKSEFEPCYHWSREQLAGNPDYAWMQHFDGGSQLCSLKSGQYRARAVRRLPI